MEAARRPLIGLCIYETTVWNCVTTAHRKPKAGVACDSWFFITTS